MKAKCQTTKDRKVKFYEIYFTNNSPDLHEV